MNSVKVTDSFSSFSEQKVAVRYDQNTRFYDRSMTIFYEFDKIAYVSHTAINSTNLLGDFRQIIGDNRIEQGLT
jgi:hypothetical protein